MTVVVRCASVTHSQKRVAVPSGATVEFGDQNGLAAFCLSKRPKPLTGLIPPEEDPEEKAVLEPNVGNPLGKKILGKAVSKWLGDGARLAAVDWVKRYDCEVGEEGCDADLPADVTQWMQPYLDRVPQPKGVKPPNRHQ